MHVLWRELASRRKSLPIWSIGMVAYMVMSFAKYNAISTDTQSIGQLLKAFPQTIQAVFGMTGLDMTTITGYYGVIYLYMLLMLAVHAGLTGADVVIDDERDHTAEFIYTRPIGRLSILTQKIVAGMVVVAVIWIVTMASSWLAMQHFVAASVFGNELWLLMGAAALVQWAFFALGCMAASISGWAKIATWTVATTVFVSYVLYAFAQLSSANAWAGHSSLFAWYDAADLLATMQLPVGMVMMTLLGGLVMLLLAYVGYARRDIHP